MERKTNVSAEEGKQEITITREFDLPVELLFKAHEDAAIFEQWMGTKVLKFESRKHGAYAFETSDPQGNVVVRANGTFHEFEPNNKITRTFEMVGAPFGVQLEFLKFDVVSDGTSKLIIHSIFESVTRRDQLLKLPFQFGLNMAHDRLQEIASRLK